jgi:hypothetical protein
LNNTGSCDVLVNLLQTREDAAKLRLSVDTSAKNDSTLYTVPNFIEKIMDQCQTVYVKHEKIASEEFVKDSVFRGLVWEMVELQVSSMIGLVAS